MAKILKTSLLCATLFIAAALACSAQVYPTVTFAFDSAAYEYSWTVDCPANSTYSFSQLWVFDNLPPSAIVLSNASGAWVEGVDQQWSFVSAPNGDGTYSFYWQAKPGQTIGAATAWTGVFKLIVPNSAPVAGQAQTSGGIVSRQLVDTFVPQVIPEPASVASLCLLLSGLGSVVIRKRK